MINRTKKNDYFNITRAKSFVNSGFCAFFVAFGYFGKGAEKEKIAFLRCKKRKKNCKKRGYFYSDIKAWVWYNFTAKSVAVPAARKDSKRRRRPTVQRAKEGDLYGVFQVFGKTFEIYYGYYEEYERSSPYNDPVPIYPDLLKSPQYDENGSPIVTEMQLSCEHYKGTEQGDQCGRCRYFQRGERLFGLCRCKHRQRDG